MQHHSAPDNKLLATFPFIYENLVTTSHKRVRWPAGAIAYDLGDSHEHTWLILSGLISLMRPVDDDKAVEATSVGPGGMIGYLGEERENGSLFKAEVQVETEALQLDVGIVRATIRENDTFRNLVRDCREGLTEQVAQALGCRSYHRTERRLARWILCAHNHLLSDHFDFTHSDLAGILGVSRSVVTAAVRRLEQLGLIDSSRKHIYILNRRGLRSMACGCLKSVVRKNIFDPWQSPP